MIPRRQPMRVLLGAATCTLHDVASLPEANPHHENCGDFSEAQTCDRKRARFRVDAGTVQPASDERARVKKRQR
jgi:hypothetical protein